MNVRIPTPNPFSLGLDIDRFVRRSAEGLLMPSPVRITSASRSGRPPGLSKRRIIMDHDQDDFEAVRKIGQRQTLILIAKVLGVVAALAVAAYFWH